MQKVTVRRVSVGTTFKLLAIGLLLSLLPFFIVMGVAGALGFNTMSLNSEPLHGWEALLLAPFIGLFVTGVFIMVMGTAIAFGLWIYSFFGPCVISFKPVDTPTSDS